MHREKLKNDLLNADFADVQSDTLSYLFSEMATKDDLRALRGDMHAEFRAVRGELKIMDAHLMAAMNQSLADIRKEMSEVHGEISKLNQSILRAQHKLFMMTLGLIGALAAIFTALDVFVN